MASRIFEYFVVCGIGPEIQTLDGVKGFQGTGIMYMPSLLDQFPLSNHSLYPPPPPQLPTICLEIHSNFGFFKLCTAEVMILLTSLKEKGMFSMLKVPISVRPRKGFNLTQHCGETVYKVKSFDV